MPKPRLADTFRYLTTSQVAEALGISLEQLYRRLAQGILPDPTKVAKSGVRLFDEDWLQRAKKILKEKPKN